MKYKDNGGKKNLKKRLKGMIVNPLLSSGFTLVIVSMKSKKKKMKEYNKMFLRAICRLVSKKL